MEKKYECNPETRECENKHTKLKEHQHGHLGIKNTSKCSGQKAKTLGKDSGENG